MAHTPGPWALGAVYDGVRNGWPVLAGHRYIACGCYLGGTDRAKANACLIASAPELLEALEEAAATFRQYQHLHAIKGTPEADLKALANEAKAARFEAVIAKARGAA